MLNILSKKDHSMCNRTSNIVQSVAINTSILEDTNCILQNVEKKSRYIFIFLNPQLRTKCQENVIGEKSMTGSSQKCQTVMMLVVMKIY